MEESNCNLSYFESLLQQQCLKPTRSIYGDKHAGKASKTNCTYTTKDVITSVKTALKAIETADIVKKSSDKNTRKNLDKYKKSAFLSVNDLPMNLEEPQQIVNNPNKFETQCVTDTQLIDEIDKAEAIMQIVTDKGMTQEFDTSFDDQNFVVTTKGILTDVKQTIQCSIDINKEEINEKSLNNKVYETQCKRKIDFVAENKTDNLLRQNILNTVEDTGLREADILYKIFPNDTEKISQNEEIDTKICSTQLFHEPMDIEADLGELGVLIEEANRSLSPVLTSKPKKPSQHLVYNLDDFENFEKLAAPLVCMNADTNIDTKKENFNLHIKETKNINDPKNEDNVELPNSPILKTISNNKRTTINPTDDHKAVQLKEYEILNDEILFSSDEEDGFIHKSLNELPLTCALETSFYSDRSDILEKNMFVGFQTASNKSIQVDISSLDKANKVFDGVEKRNCEPVSLTELVEQWDSIVHSNIDLSGINDVKKEQKFVRADCKTICGKKVSFISEVLSKMEDQSQSNSHNAIPHKNIKLDDNKEIVNIKEENIKLQGFKTASNKNIHLSDKAMEKVKNIFQDINFNEDFHVKHIEEPVITNSIVEPGQSNTPKFQVNFEGLKTANNENIMISQRSKEQSNNLFHDKNNEKSLDTENVIVTDFKGFTTASNKPIVISEKAIANTKNIFKDLEIDEKLVEVEDDLFLDNFNDELSDVLDDAESKCKAIVALTTYANNAATVIENPGFIGFKTASNKTINVSEQALAQTKIIFQDIDTINEEGEGKAKKISESKSPMFEGFLTTATTSNKDTKNTITGFGMSNSISINNSNNQRNILSNETCTKQSSATSDGHNDNVNSNLIKSTTLCNINKDDFPMQFADNEPVFLGFKSKKVEESKAFTGFQTASNKKVEISKEALAKSRQLFDDLELTDLKSTSLTEDNSFEGFQTASKNKVDISIQALEQSNEIFQDIDEKKDYQTGRLEITEVSEEERTRTKRRFENNNTSKATESAVNDNQIKECIGFHTASNKKVKISKEALTKTKNIFQDIKFSQSADVLENKISKFSGFQTASNKRVEISESSLAKTKNIFQDIEISQNVDILENKITTFSGFQTASNKKVEISEDSLAKTKNIFQDIDFSQKVDAIENNHSTLQGFQTAGEKRVHVSKEALHTTKKIFQAIDNNVLDKNRNVFVGFQTANNKTVEISEEALAKTKQVFQDIEFSQNLATKLNENTTNKRYHTVNNENFKISEDSSEKYKDIEITHVEINKKESKVTATKNKLTNDHTNDDVEVENYINTQVLNNFDESLNTEDFCKSPKVVKRSGSPILSCPRAKKRKSFQTPYRLKPESVTPKSPPKTSKIPENSFNFNNNYKKTKLLHLKDIDLLEHKSKDAVKIDHYISAFKFENLLKFEFTDQRNDVTDTKMTIDNLKHIFLNSVDKRIVPDNWLNNHLKLILWKLISYEIKFPKSMRNICNARAVIEQLKYRYDRELYKVERPALRKIYEKDDVSTRAVVLCVVGIFEDDVNVTSVTSLTRTIDLLLTDGWYCIRACLDRMLSKLVFDGKIMIGSKIMTCGAELLNCEQGVSPWEDTSKVRLKIFGNSTRRAHWLTRLGYHGNAAILSHLSTVRVDGGKVSRTKMFVARIYPMLYVEKFNDGSTVTRSDRLEQIHQTRFETERQKLMEKIYEDIEKEYSDQESQESDLSIDTGFKRKTPQSGSQIAKMMKRSRDPAEFRSHLTYSQTARLEDHSAKTRERLMSDIHRRVQERLAGHQLGSRNVVPLLKIRVCAVRERGDLDVCNGVMTIWRPNDAILELLQEGAWIDVMNVVPTAVRYSEIQLSAGRQSTFSRAKMKETLKISAYTKNKNRICYSMNTLSENPNLITDYNEIDTTGFVFLIDPPTKEFDKESIKQQHFQNVFLADAAKNIICVNFWGGIKKFGFENIIDTGQIVSCANLQKRIGNTRKNIPQYRVTEFTHFTKTPKNPKSRSAIEELEKKFNGIDKKKFCQECAEKKNNFAAIKYQNNAEISPYRFYADLNLSKNKRFIDSPLQKQTVKVAEDLNLTGLDFESTFKQKETQDLSPEVLRRKQKVQERIAKLKMYGEPPPLSPILVINKSKNAANSYKSPIISKTNTSEQNLYTESPKTTLAKNYTINEESAKRNYQNNNVANPSGENLPKSVNIVSPLASMNRTFVKRISVNPVKLNFANNIVFDDSNIDHFAEDFDGSPPLSLD